MRAVFYARFGGPDVLKFGDIAEPTPGPDDVLIHVRCSGVNPVDWKVREGYMKGFMPYAFPIIPGFDASGEIAALGANVRGWSIGDRVFAFCGIGSIQWGTAAEYTLAPASALARTPKSLTDRQAAGVPLVALTAYQALFDIGELEAGQQIFVPAASGGVGSFAVGLAKAKGARVVGSCGPDNIDYVRSLGADEVINYRDGDAWAAAKALTPGGYDLVLNTVQGTDPTAAMDALKPGGPLDAALLQARGLRGQMVYVTPNGAQLADIASLIEQGRLKVPDVTAYPLEKCGEAHLASQTHHVRGKLVLDVR
jgi:NADPH:quinone reductase